VARYLLDTSFLIDAMRGDPPAIARLELLWSDADSMYVNEVVVCELFSGLREPDVERGRALLRPIEFVQPGPEAAVDAGGWRREAAARGRALSVPDALIAATAVSLDAAVLTRNVRDFALTTVRVETY
jgi:tRNA(fMet)-specific endonuclease VapC